MGKFIFEKCGGIDGLYLIQPAVFGDNRGYFMETYNYEDFKEAGLDMVLYRTISRVLQRECFGGCISRKSIHRESWCVCCMAKSLT